MGMRLGDSIRVTLFGESHGRCVGALVEGIPAGTEIDLLALNEDIAKRKPGRKGLSLANCITYLEFRCKIQGLQFPP